MISLEKEVIGDLKKTEQLPLPPPPPGPLASIVASPKGFFLSFKSHALVGFAGCGKCQIAAQP